MVVVVVQLVINQMTGKYKCNSDNIIELYKKAKELEKEFEKIYYVHILRNFNIRADELSNKAVKDYIHDTLHYIHDKLM